MIVNAAKLDAELRAAGVPIDGCSSGGRIDYRPEATDGHRAIAAAVLAAHDPAPTEAQRIMELGVPPRVFAALVVRTSSRWSGLTATRRARIQQILDDAADAVIARLDP